MGIPDWIIHEVAQHFSLASSNIVGRRRPVRFVQARKIAVFIMRENLSMSLQDIGDALGGRDHTTIMHAMKEPLTGNDLIVKCRIAKLLEQGKWQSSLSESTLTAEGSTSPMQSGQSASVS